MNQLRLKRGFAVVFWESASPGSLEASSHTWAGLSGPAVPLADTAARHREGRGLELASAPTWLAPRGNPRRRGRDPAGPGRKGRGGGALPGPFKQAAEERGDSAGQARPSGGSPRSRGPRDQSRPRRPQLTEAPADWGHISTLTGADQGRRPAAPAAQVVPPAQVGVFRAGRCPPYPLPPHCGDAGWSCRET